jgi:RimJ/RimL family protein N-acetyltransferase
MNEPSSDIPTHFETNRLILRCYQPGDNHWFYSMCRRNRSHLMRYESDNFIMEADSEEKAASILFELAEAWKSGKYLCIGAFEKNSQEFMAQIVARLVDPDLPEYEIGYFADKDHEGLGYVTEAVTATLAFVFDVLKAHRIRAVCDDTNVRSRRVAKRCGMLEEGHIRENKRDPQGNFSGTVHFGILDNDFRKNTLNS